MKPDQFFLTLFKKDIIWLIAGIVGILFLFVLNLKIGEVFIPVDDIVTILTGGKVENNAWSFIIESRLYRSFAAVFAGAALSLCGIILQVYFRNPLAGPGVLGITSGASLGVAFVILGGLQATSWLGNLGIISAGIIGAMIVLMLLLTVSSFVSNPVTLLVLGLMFSYFISAIVNVLFLWANLDDTRQYVLWSLGSFDDMTSESILLLGSSVIILSFISIMLIKPLNALVLGTEYASSAGINLKKTRWLVITVTGILAAVVTVYCGPVSFIGVAVPQMIRLITKTKNHAYQIPAVMILGGALGLLSDLIVRLSGNSLPLNTVTALVGAPVIIYTIIRLNNRVT